MFELGINNCFAVKRWPEPAVWSRQIAETFELRVVQFSFDLLDPKTDPDVQAAAGEQIRQALAESKLKLHSTFTGLGAYSLNLLLHPQLGMRLDALDWYERAIQLSGRLQAETTGGHFGALSMEDFTNPGRKEYLFDFLAEALLHLSCRAKQAGLRYLLWEPMPCLREAPATIREALDLHDRMNRGAAVPIHFCLDLGHQCTIGVKDEDRDPYEWLRQIGALCPCIHLQQTDGQGDHHWPFSEEYNRRGIIHPDRVLEALSKAGAREAYLILEIIHPFEEDESKTLADIRESASLWKKYLDHEKD